MGQGRGAGQGMGAGQDRPSFEDLDRDGDGSISKDEFVDFRNQRISERVQQGRSMKRLGEAPSFEELDLDSFLCRADRALYTAKAQGRDGWVVFGVDEAQEDC